MQVKDILRAKETNVISIQPDVTVHTAMQTMITHHIGSLIVLDDQGQVIGIITERDILRECTARSEQVKTTLVQQVMTKDLIISIPDDEVGYIMGVMTQNRIRHLPILDEGRLEGLISIGDVVKAQLEATEFENRYLREYIQQ